MYREKKFTCSGELLIYIIKVQIPIDFGVGKVRDEKFCNVTEVSIARISSNTNLSYSIKVDYGNRLGLKSRQSRGLIFVL